MATLRLVPASGQPIDVLNDVAVVGRDPSCEVVVADGSVSRKHARLERRAGAWWVVDQGSANGTYVNSLRIAEQALKNGQELRFGALAFRVELKEDPEATVATPIVTDDSATVMATPIELAKPVAPAAAAEGRTARASAGAAERCRRERALQERVALGRRRGRARASDARRAGSGQEGQEPVRLDRRRLLRLPVARGDLRSRDLRRDLLRHEGSGRRHARVAGAGAPGPDRGAAGEPQRELPLPARRGPAPGDHRSDRALAGRDLPGALGRRTIAPR